MGRFRAAVAAALMVIAGCMGARAAGGAATADPSTLPIVAIHGYDAQDCPGSDSSYGWAGFDHVLRGAGYTGALLPVSFYACDFNGADISGYDADTPAATTAAVTTARTRSGYYQDTSLVTIAHDLAWYVYRNFTVRGQAVNMVSLSMGGIIARTAIYRVQIGDPSFPPQLRVAQSITFSTPHRGVGTMASNGADDGCRHHVQCMEWGADSPLLIELMRDATDPQGTGGTQWTTIGSSAGCDFLPTDSALGLPHALQVDLTAPCYSHIGYFWDIDTAPTATAVIRDGDTSVPTTITNALHSLTMVTVLLQNPRAPAAPLPPPVPTVTSLPAVTVTPRVAVGFTATPPSDVQRFDLRYRVAKGTGTLGAWGTPASMKQLAAGTRSFTPPAGTTQYCVSARVFQGATVSAWSPSACTAIPVDDRRMTLSAGWSAQGAPDAVAGTMSRADSAGATATVAVRARQLGLIVTTCPSCGSLQYTVDGKTWRTVSTRSATTVPHAVLLQPAFPGTRSTTVTIRSGSAAPVYLDGLATLR